MAQTKTRATSSSGAKAERKQAKPRKPSASRNTKTRQRKPTKNGGGQVESARKAVESTAKHAGSSVGEVGRSVGRTASKARTPLLAGGAAVAGAAGGLALGSRRAHKSKALRRPRVKIRSRDLAWAARDVGQFGMDVGQLAGELRKNREAANGVKHRSPVEVVLDGLTHRRHDD